MAVDTKETIKMIRNMVMELLSGLTAESILETGAKVNNMEKEFTSKRVKRDKAFGKWARESSGSKITKLTNEHNTPHTFKINSFILITFYNWL